MRPLFGNVRDVQRFLNVLPVILEAIREDLALEDLLTLEALRIQTPDVLSKMAESIDALTTVSGPFIGEPDTYGASRTEELSAILDTAGVLRPVVEQALQRLFPASGRYLGNMHYGHEWLRTWRKNRRVAHAAVFRFYLEKNLPPGSLSAGRIQRLFEALGDPDTLRTMLRNLSTAELEYALERLEDYEDDYPQDAVESAVRVLLECWTRLPNRSPVMAPSPEVKMSR